MKKNFLSISGIDGSGKSTQFELLKEHYESLGFKVFYLWTRGGSTPGINSLKSFLRLIVGKKLPASGHSKKRDEMFKNEIIQYLWITAAIFDLIRIYAFSIRWRLVKGYIVICDRYILDTLIDFKLMFPNVKFENWFLWKLLVKLSPIPFKEVLLMIPIKVSEDRCKQKFDPFPDSPEIRIKRYNFYKDFSKKGHFDLVDAQKSEKQVLEEIIN